MTGKKIEHTKIDVKDLFQQRGSNNGAKSSERIQLEQEFRRESIKLFQQCSSSKQDMSTYR